MLTETAAPWLADAQALGALIGDSLAAHGIAGQRVAVAVLGTRDELDVEDDETAGALPVHVFGNQVIVGPFSETVPCGRCLARRWQAGRTAALRDALELGSGARLASESPFVTAFVADFVAALAAAHLAAPPGGAAAIALVEALVETAFAPVYHLDLDRMIVRSYRLVPDPECPNCGRRGADSPQRAALVLRPAAKPTPTTFRVTELDAYDVGVDAFANPVCGAVGPGVLADLGSLSSAAVSSGFSTRSGTYLRQTLWGGHAETYADSTRIGVLEGLERYAGIRPRGRTPSVVASLQELTEAGTPALDPRECGVYSDDFYRSHPEVRPFASTREIRWVWGYSLRDQHALLVPEVLAHYQAAPQIDRFVQASSSGCATGACLEEAVYHGLMEAVERDAFLIAWYGGASLPEIDPRSSGSARTRQMVDRLAMYGYEARFFDTRITFPIPVVTGVAVRYDGGPGTLCVGAGASLDPEAAMSAALCEIATDSVNLRGRFERDEARLRAMAGDFGRVHELHDHPLMYGNPDMATHLAFLLGEPGGQRSAGSLATVYGPGRPAPPLSMDLRTDLEWCLRAVTARGFDVVVVDQTLPEQRDLGLVTVNVMVPGLLPIDFGWARQRALQMPRLRTALREAGLADHDLQPHELHRVPHPFP